MRRAFTILELLVSLAIIGLLVSLAVVSWAGVRASAGKTQSLNALRNMTRGYLAYSADFNQKLMPGFLRADQFSTTPVPAGDFPYPKLPSGHELDQCSGDLCDGSAYVWRLAPYLDNAWKAYLADYSSKSLESQLVAEYGHGDDAGVYGPATADFLGADGTPTPDDEVGIATAPSFGLNSVFLGGDAVHGGQAVVERCPFPGIMNPTKEPIAATSLGSVINPGRVTVFGASMRSEAQLSSGDPVTDGFWMQDKIPGSPELRPPFCGYDAATNTRSLLQWHVDNEGVITEDPGAANDAFSSGGGWPVGRWDENDIPVSHLDGSVEIINRYELANDFRFWSPFATGIR